MIGFAEKDKFKSNTSYSVRFLVPVFMVKDGVEYFVVNRVEADSDPTWGDYEKRKSRKETEQYKAFLTRNEGRYFKFHGGYDDPLEMIAEIEKSQHTFTNPDDLFVDCSKGSRFVDFHGNLREVSAAFHYRIYDDRLVEKIRIAVCPIVSRSNECSTEAGKKEHDV